MPFPLTRRRFVALLGSLTMGAAVARLGLVTPALAADGTTDGAINEGASDDGLNDTLASLEARLGARLGVSILDTGSGRRWGYREDERFPMCSTFKVLACAALLARVDEGRESLDRRVRFGTDELVTYSPVTERHAGGDGMTLEALCEATMTLSDNTAANLILAAMEGPGSVTGFARSLGDEITRLDRWETELNEATPGDPRDTTTPAAMVDSLRELFLGERLSESSRIRLTEWFVASRTGDARLRAGLPRDWRVGDRTGSGERGTANNVAVIWPGDREPVVVSVYLTETEAPPAARDAAIAEIGRALTAALEG